MTGGRGRIRGRSWPVRPGRGLFALILALSVGVAGCAGVTPVELAYKSAGVLLVASQQVRAECDRSKAQGIALSQLEPDPVKAQVIREQGIPPFTKKTCGSLALAYQAAKPAAQEALRLTDQGGSAPPELTAAGINYVLTAAKILGDAGVRPAKQVQDFVDGVNQWLLKPVEVR